MLCSRHRSERCDAAPCLMDVSAEIRFISRSRCILGSRGIKATGRKLRSCKCSAHNIKWYATSSAVIQVVVTQIPRLRKESHALTNLLQSAPISPGCDSLKFLKLNVHGTPENDTTSGDER